MPYFLKKLKDTPDGEHTLLDNTLVIYGSPMGNSNVHNHKRCPLFLAGKAGGALRGGLHLKAADGTPMANVFLSVLQRHRPRRHEDVRRQHRPFRFEDACPATTAPRNKRPESCGSRESDLGQSLAATLRDRVDRVAERRGHRRRWPTP